MKHYLPDGQEGVQNSEALLLAMYPTAVRHGNTPGKWKIPGGIAATTFRGVTVQLTRRTMSV